MRRVLAVLACCMFITASLRGSEPLTPDGMPFGQQGGLIIMRKGNQTTVMMGGGLLPRKVRVTTETPEGPVVTRFTLPSHLAVSYPPLPEPFAAFIRVEIPDTIGVLSLEGELIASKGTLRYLQSPPLPPGTTYPVRLRAAWMVGDRILIEEQPVVLRPGETIAVKFDGSRAISVPYPVREKN